MIQKPFYIACVFVLLGGLLGACGQANLPAAQAPVPAESIAGLVAKYRQEISQKMQQDQIPGLAIAVVDDQSVLWAEGFGYTDWDRQTPVTPSTIFSLQSMSKSFTGTAAMFAAQDGLVDLDAPITTYLPNFRVNSIFEEHPEQKMTLRILLSHTAGFPHDTAYGGNYDSQADFSFEKHIASISDNWLMFPVGARYSYSNVGIDLAGYILQVRSGMPFIQYVQQKVFDPLGMKDSMLDFRQVRASATRAFGHTDIPVRVPVDLLIIPSGGVWSSVEDMARYVQFHINEGALGGVRLLKADLAATMYTPPNYPARKEGYALGVTTGMRNGAVYIEHGGGGFGFIDDMGWYPELKLGVVVLTNSDKTGSYAFNLALKVLDDIIAGNIPHYRQQYISYKKTSPSHPAQVKMDNLSDEALLNLIRSKALPQDAAALQRRSSYAGTYIITDRGFPGETFEISAPTGELGWSYQGKLSLYSKYSTLTEVQPGLFFSENGSLLDLRGPVPMIDNIRLVKANTRLLPFQIAFYAISGLFFLFALFFWPVRLVTGRIGRKSAPEQEGAARSPRSPWLLWVGGLAALASLLSLVCLALVALIPNLIYVPWPRPFPELLWWQAALVGLPFINLLLAAGVTLVSALSWRKYAWEGAIKWYYLALGPLLLAFNLALIF
ncbi:MAG TPA: serine hydrolase domain-containing protein [Anaerolineales bacterium]